MQQNLKGFFKVLMLIPSLVDDFMFNCSDYNICMTSNFNYLFDFTLKKTFVTDNQNCITKDM